MCFYTMSHQTINENDFVSTRTTQTLKDFTNSKIPPHWLCNAYYKVSNIFIKLWKMFLNVIFTLIKFLIEFGLNLALAVVLFVYIQILFVYLFKQIFFVCLFTYSISIISWSLKLEQITPPCQLCHAYFKVSNIFYYIS